MYPGYLLLFIICELLLRKKFMRCSEEEPKQYTYEEIKVEAINGRELFLYDNNVCDLTSYMDWHPGKNLLKEHVGMEIGRYIYGGFSGSDSRVQYHSGRAKDIIDKTVCGTVKPIFELVLSQNPEEGKWKIVGKEQFTKIHQVIRFSLPGTKITAMAPGVNHCGTYVKVYSKSNQMTRNYSWSFLSNTTIYRQHVKLPEALKDRSVFSPISPTISDFTKNYVEICVKKQNGFSKWLHEVASDVDEFDIRGPFGPGLQLKPDIGGTIIGIALGTAIVPFLDLVGYLMRMNVYNISTRNEGKSLKMFEDETFEFLSNPTFKLVLFVSVKNVDEAVGLGLLESLAEFCKETGIKNFDLKLRVSENGQRRWDKKYFEEAVDAKTVTKAYIASVAGTEASFTELLEGIGISKELITIL